MGNVTISKEEYDSIMNRLEHSEIENKILRRYLERLGVWPSEELMHIDELKED